ncbi:MAG: VacJ family lipoprotein [Deltaproteobacteria bacterium]|nr:VacJ family lipoprotein [Deltaproteobacteria bacterium]
MINVTGRWRNSRGVWLGAVLFVQVLFFLQAQQVAAQLKRARSPDYPIKSIGTMGRDGGASARHAGLSVVAKGDEAVPRATSEDGEVFPDDFPDEPFPEEDTRIPDPLEPINRVVYHFNDRLYFWLLKPLAIGYSAIAPEALRISISDFFYNLAFPIRFVNCMLQSKFEEAGEEVRSFTINTICGLGGFLDVAGKDQGIKKFDEDFGQTLGYYGLGPGFFVMWPVLGPSSLRDTVGFLGDRFLYPASYILDPTTASFVFNALDYVNETSLRIGEYEDLKKASFDPYIAVRNAFYQYRSAKIEE